MKNNLHSLIRKIFLSSIAAIAAKDSASAAVYKDHPVLKRNELEVVTPKTNDLSKKLLLKRNKNSEWFTMAHRSHRSHSSHRSHYSSTSGRTTTSPTSRTTPTTSRTRTTTGTSTTNVPRNTSTTTYPSTRTTAPSTSRNNTATNTKSSQPQSANFRLSATTLKLGDRNLKLGMIGSDVTQLINILIQKGYLKLANGVTQVTGIYTYDETVEAVVKRFQKDHGLEGDGTCGPSTIYHLLKK